MARMPAGRRYDVPPRPEDFHVHAGPAFGILARQQWVRIPTVITSVMTLGPWIAATLSAAIAHRWPVSDIGVGAISLMPGLLLAAIWVWCPFAVARISTPRATAV